MENVTKYFTAEKNESVLFIAVGIIAIALGLYFIFILKRPYYNGIAYALILIALIQITVGYTVLVRSPQDIIRVNEIISIEPTKISSEEIPRMNTVMKNFVVYRYVEIALAVLGLFLFYKGMEGGMWKGFGIGLAIQSLVMLLLDFFAESRGTKYLNYLISLIS